MTKNNIYKSSTVVYGSPSFDGAGRMIIAEKMVGTMITSTTGQLAHNTHNDNTATLYVYRFTGLN